MSKIEITNKRRMWNYSHNLWRELDILTKEVLTIKKNTYTPNDYDELLESIVECRDKIEEFKMKKCNTNNL
jgi:hypothetical protein